MFAVEFPAARLKAKLSVERLLWHISLGYMACRKRIDVLSCRWGGVSVLADLHGSGVLLSRGRKAGVDRLHTIGYTNINVKEARGSHITSMI